VEGGESGENALVPAHTSKRMDRLLNARLRLLPVKEILELLLRIVNKSVRVRTQVNRISSDLSGVVKAVGHGRKGDYNLLAGAFSSIGSSLLASRCFPVSGTTHYFDPVCRPMPCRSLIDH
jgi:hypothetical protein